MSPRSDQPAKPTPERSSNWDHGDVETPPLTRDAHGERPASPGHFLESDVLPGGIILAVDGDNLVAVLDARPSRRGVRHDMADDRFPAVRLDRKSTRLN